MGGYEEDGEGEDGGEGEGEEEYEDTTWSSNGPSDAEGLCAQRYDSFSVCLNQTRPSPPFSLAHIDGVSQPLSTQTFPKALS